MRSISILILLVMLPWASSAQEQPSHPWSTLSRMIGSFAQSAYTHSERSAHAQLNSLTETFAPPLRDAQTLIETKTGDVEALGRALDTARIAIAAAQTQVQVFKDAVVNTPLSWGYIGTVRREAVETFRRIRDARQSLDTLQKALDTAKQF